MKYLPSFAYVIIFALASVLVDEQVESVSPRVILFLTILLATVGYWLVNVHKTRSIFQEVYQHKKLFLKLNLNTLLALPFFIYSVAFVGATSYIYLFCISLVLFSVFYEYILMKRKERVQWVTALSIFVLIMVYFIYDPFSLLGLFGSLLAIGAGALGFHYSIISYEISGQTKLGASQVMACRFILTILVLIPFLPFKEIISLSLVTWGNIVLITFLTFSVPLYFGQLGIIKIGPEKHSAVLGFMPMTVYFLQGLILNEWEPWLFVLSVIAAGFLFVRAVWLIYNAKKSL